MPNWGRARGGGGMRQGLHGNFLDNHGRTLTHTFIREAKPENILRGTRRLCFLPHCAFMRALTDS